MAPAEIHAQEAAKTYRVTYYRPGQNEPAEVKEFQGLAYGTVQLKAEEWREWTGGQAVIEVIEEPEDAQEDAPGYVVRYGNRIADGRSMEFTTPMWDFRPLAERDASWKLSDGWDFADVTPVRVDHLENR